MDTDYDEDIPGVDNCMQFESAAYASNGKKENDNIANSELEGSKHLMESSDTPAEQSWSENGAASASTPDVWVETRTDTGKCYFYHSVTRETTWEKPVGLNVKIMTQEEVEHMSKQQTPNNKDEKDEGERLALTAQQQTVPNMLNQPPPSVSAQQAVLNQPPPNIHQQPPPMFQPGYGQHPYGMPPPAYGYPANQVPWGMPPWGQHLPAANQQEQPAKTLIIKPGVIDPAVIARAAEWSEHRAPDGRPYYYHAARGESVWEKPQALRDMEAARMALHGGPPKQPAPVTQPPSLTAVVPHHIMQNQMMHIPPTAVSAGYDPAVAYAAAAAATIKANEAKSAQAGSNEKDAKKTTEDKKKEEPKKQTVVKPVDKSKPVSSTAIAGTPWCVVWTGDGRVFYYNPSSRTSVWERPEELMDREDVDKAIRERPEQLKPLQQQDNSEQKNIITDAKGKHDAFLNEAPSVEAAAISEEHEAEDDDIIKIQSGSDSEIEDIAAKKPRIASRSTRKAEAGEAAMEAEQRAAKERALVPLEKRVAQFKDMLREKDVSAFSTWEKELHKIVFDPRYLLLTSKERKQVFERYVKDRAEEERMEKRNKMRQKRENFRSLLEEVKLHGRSSFSDFSQRHGKDERYRAIEKLRERENLFNEYLVEVRRQEKEERFQRKEQIRTDFFNMLRERGDVDRYTRWHDIKRKFESDVRYRAVESSAYREEYFEDYLHMIKEEKRKEREMREERDREKERERKSEKHDKDQKDRKEKKRDRDRSRSKERLIKDDGNKKEKKEKRADSRKEYEMQENERKGSDGELSTHSGKDEQNDNDNAERLQKERERQLRAEQSIREREREVQRTLAGHLRDRDKEREHHKRDEAIGHFGALLTDLVRNPDFTWKEIKKQLRRDHRWELVEALDRELREKLFNEHIESLLKKKRESFHEMLNEISTLELTSHWKDIKKLIRDDPRYLKFNAEKCEREFRDYIRNRTASAKVALRELLQECKFITHKSLEIIKENPNHLKEIQEILKKDKRYLVLDHLEDERSKIIKTFLTEMHERGPPPPPTASDSARRTK